MQTSGPIIAVFFWVATAPPIRITTAAPYSRRCERVSDFSSQVKAKGRVIESITAVASGWTAGPKICSRPIESIEPIPSGRT